MGATIRSGLALVNVWSIMQQEQEQEAMSLGEGDGCLDDLTEDDTRGCNEKLGEDDTRGCVESLNYNCVSARLH